MFNFEDYEDKYGKNLKAMGIKTPSKSNIKKRMDSQMSSKFFKDAPPQVVGFAPSSSSALQKSNAENCPPIPIQNPAPNPSMSPKLKVSQPLTTVSLSEVLVNTVSRFNPREFLFRYLIGQMIFHLILSTNVWPLEEL